MIGQERIKEMKRNGEVIVTQATFKKSVKILQMNGGTCYQYKGKLYRRADWLLTYGHDQYERLIP